MCGLVGVVGVPGAAEQVELGLHRVPHRGPDSVGITAFDGREMVSVRQFGTVSEVFREVDCATRLPGSHAIGHVRYPTAGNKRRDAENIQPIPVWMPNQDQVVIAHNGNLTNTRKLRARLQARACITRSTSDTEIILHLLAEQQALRPDATISQILAENVFPELEGAYSLLFLTKDGIIAATDPYNMRPLYMGRIKNGWAFASEDTALTFLGATDLTPILGGTIVTAYVGAEPKWHTYATPLFHRQCSMEVVYFAHPASHVFKASVHGIRKALGIALARENPGDREIADIVAPIPDSANIFAEWLASTLGLEHGMALIRYHGVGRSFVADEETRELILRLKHTAVPDLVRGKRILLVDDSIVRGSTLKRVVGILKAAGALEIHIRIGSPPIVSPCRWGIDTPTKEELIATHMGPEALAAYLGVDSLKYLSLEGYMNALGDVAGNTWCTSCFTGKHPIEEAT